MVGDGEDSTRLAVGAQRRRVLRSARGSGCGAFFVGPSLRPGLLLAAMKHKKLGREMRRWKENKTKDGKIFRSRGKEMWRAEKKDKLAVLPTRESARPAACRLEHSGSACWSCVSVNGRRHDWVVAPPTLRENSALADAKPSSIFSKQEQSMIIISWHALSLSRTACVCEVLMRLTRRHGRDMGRYSQMGAAPSKSEESKMVRSRQIGKATLPHDTAQDGDARSFDACPSLLS